MASISFCSRIVEIMTNRRNNDPHSQAGLKVEIQRKGSLAIIRLRGASQPANTKSLDDLLAQLLEEDMLYYVLDLSETRMINSQQIGVIVRHIQQLMQKTTGGFAFANPPDRIRYLLDMTCASDLAPIFDSVEDAIQSFNLPT
jgi:anti-anti-sigma factor